MMAGDAPRSQPSFRGSRRPIHCEHAAAGVASLARALRLVRHDRFHGPLTVFAHLAGDVDRTEKFSGPCVESLASILAGAPNDPSVLGMGRKVRDRGEAESEPDEEVKPVPNDARAGIRTQV